MKFVSYSALDQLPESANALFAQGAKGSLFFSRPWFENLLDTALEDGQELLLACVAAEEQILAILPLVQSGGQALYSLKHRYSSLYSLLLADHNQQQILNCLAQGLLQLPYKALLLEPIDENNHRIKQLQHSLEAVGFECESSFRFYNWILKVQGQSFQTYLAARPAKLRNTIARKQRKLEREQNSEIRLFCGNEVPAAMADYQAVYQASWKANEQFGELLDGMVSGFSKQGWSRLAVLYIEGQPAASQLWFVVDRKASIFRLAYDEAWKRYSPGSILTSFLMEYVIETDGVEEIDFLTGNDTYKQDWMSDRRERHALSCVKKDNPKGRLARFFDFLSLLIKRGLRRGLIFFTTAI